MKERRGYGVLGLGAAGVLLLSASAPAGVIGYWQFDDGAAGTSASSLVSEAGGLTGVASGVGSGGAAPKFDALVVGGTITDGVGGAVLNNANTTSLHFVDAGLPGDPNSHNGGQVAIADPAAGNPGNTTLEPRNLTIEAFVKIDRHVNFASFIGKARADSGGATFELDSNSNDTLKVRFDSQALGTGGNGVSGFNENLISTVNLNDGNWHHIAMTYDDATRAAKVYVDYQLVSSGTVVYPLVYDASSLLLGNGAGGRAFDGWLDEVRLSDTVLAPDQMLHVATVPAPSALVGGAALLGLVAVKRKARGG